MATSLEGKAVIVTGSSSGIGRATALRFGSEGASVAVTYHTDEAGAERTAAEVVDRGGDAMTARFDLLDDASVASMVRDVVSRWDGVDVLVNNAVVWSQSTRDGATAFEDLPPADWRRLIRGNLEGSFLTTQHVVPSMKERGWGRIVNVSSSLAADGLPGSAHYVSAKAGLHGLTRTLAVELATYGILTNTVLPGMTLTERGQRMIPTRVQAAVASETPTNRLTTPEEVADLTVFLGSGRNGHVNGEAIRVTGGR